jgi:inosine/xanthosine triphosphate pyrophosphatase family protein
MKEHCVLHGTIFPRESISKSFGYGSMFMTTSHQSEFISLAISIKKKWGMPHFSTIAGKSLVGPYAI